MEQKRTGPIENDDNSIEENKRREYVDKAFKYDKLVVEFENYKRGLKVPLPLKLFLSFSGIIAVVFALSSFAIVWSVNTESYLINAVGWGGVAMGIVVGVSGVIVLSNWKVFAPEAYRKSY